VAVRGGEGYKDEQFPGGEEGDGAEGRADFFQAFAAKRGCGGLVGFDVTASSSGPRAQRSLGGNWSP